MELKIRSVTQEDVPRRYHADPSDGDGIIERVNLQAVEKLPKALRVPSRDYNKKDCVHTPFSGRAKWY